MLEWADDNTQQSQDYWAGALGTTTSGTAISSMVALTNSQTNWDVKAGAYIVQSVATWSSSTFWQWHLAHLGDADPAPIIEHPRLLSRYYNYLNFDHGGHFQVGRGYNRADNTLALFEPFNEADFSSGGAVTPRAPYVRYDSVFQATLANTSFKNIGM